MGTICEAGKISAAQCATDRGGENHLPVVMIARHRRCLPVPVSETRPRMWLLDM